MIWLDPKNHQFRKTVDNGFIQSLNSTYPTKHVWGLKLWSFSERVQTFSRDLTSPIFKGVGCLLFKEQKLEWSLPILRVKSEKVHWKFVKELNQLSYHWLVLGSTCWKCLLLSKSYRLIRGLYTQSQLQLFCIGILLCCERGI